MKPGKTAKTLLIAAIGLLGSAAILAGSSFVLSKLIGRAEVSETDTAFADLLSTAAKEQTVSACRSVSVTGGKRTEIAVKAVETGAVLSVTETDISGIALRREEKAVDSIIFEQLTAAVAGYRLTGYTAKDLPANYVLFTLNGTDYLFDAEGTDADAVSGAKALRDVLTYYLK